MGAGGDAFGGPEKIEAQLERFGDRGDGEPLFRKSNRVKSQKNAPDFDVRSHLYRVTGVDLTRIDGVDGPRH